MAGGWDICPDHVSDGFVNGSPGVKYVLCVS